MKKKHIFFISKFLLLILSRIDMAYFTYPSHSASLSFLWQDLTQDDLNNMNDHPMLLSV